MKVAVAGGTGTVGRLLVDRLAADGHDVVVLSRRTGVDVRTGRGLEAALLGVAAVVDVLSTTATGSRAAADFFATTTRRLLTAGTAAGVGHHVALSIVGIDGAAYAYYRGKLAQESALASSTGVGWSVLRTTQFHEFAGQVLDRFSLGPVAAVPRMRVQPVAAAAVAEYLAELASGPPVGRARDLAGPRQEELVDMARAMAAAHGIRRVLPLRVPGAAGRQMRDGTLLAGPEARIAGPDFTTWSRDPR